MNLTNREAYAVYLCVCTHHFVSIIRWDEYKFSVKKALTDIFPVSRSLFTSFQAHCFQFDSPGGPGGPGYPAGPVTPVGPVGPGRP